MVLFFTILLAVSLAGMLGLLMLKRYELTTGKVVLVGIRPRVNSFFQKILLLIQQILPALAQRQLEKAWRFALDKTQHAIAYSAVTFERVLEKVLRVIRERTERAHPSQEPSAFLREVADHKKHLLYKKGLKKSPPRDTLPG